MLMEVKMNQQKKSAKSNATNHGQGSHGQNFARKPRRSVKIEGNCLTNMLREGRAKVIDASNLGKRLSSEIWSSFGAIQVEDNFSHPSIETRCVADGSATIKICQFFVACSRCFSVFKYDGHAYGTTGLVKHVKICQGTNQQNNNTNQNNQNANATSTLSSTPHGNCIENVLTTVPNSTTTTTTTAHTNGLVTTRRRREPTTRPRVAQPTLKYLAKLIEDLRTEQSDLKQKIHELINMMGTQYVGQIQIISNDGDKVEEEMQKPIERT